MANEIRLSEGLAENELRRLHEFLSPGPTVLLDELIVIIDSHQHDGEARSTVLPSNEVLSHSKKKCRTIASVRQRFGRLIAGGLTAVLCRVRR
jgi:hypothetical protein